MTYKHKQLGEEWWKNVGGNRGGCVGICLQSNTVFTSGVGNGQRMNGCDVKWRKGKRQDANDLKEPYCDLMWCVWCDSG